MINGLNNGKVNYNVFDHGKEWKVEYNKAFQNSFDGSSMEDLNRYLKINGDKIQLALRGLNFVLTGTCSIRYCI